MQPVTRFAYLDSIRGLAALSVVFSHFFLAYGLPESVSTVLTNTPLHIFWDGFAAVSMFFVLSGYVLSKKYFSAPLPNYFLFGAARFARIWIPFAVTLLFSYLLWKGFPPEDRFFTFETPWLRSFWRNVGHLQYQSLLFLNDGVDRLVPQDWTLSQELDISLLLPVFVLMARRGWWPFALAGVLSILSFRLPILTIHFSLGVLLARYEAAATQLFTRPAAKICLLLAGLFFYTFRFSVPIAYPALMPEQRIWYVTGLGASMLLLYVLVEARVQAFLNRGWLTYLGSLSYAVYLLHFAILTAFVPRLIFFLSRWVGDQNCLRLAGLVVCLALTGIVSHIFHLCVDRVAIHLSRVILRRKALAPQSELKAPAL